MNRVVRNTLIVLAVVVLAGGIFMAGNVFARFPAFRAGRMMGGLGWNKADRRAYGPGMMGQGYATGQGTGMMGRSAGTGVGMMSSRRGYPGMMGAYGNANVTPLTIDQAYQAAGKYLAGLNNADLKIAEVMVFNNNAYVRVVEKSTGIGAMELLVDPATQVVYPEHGPNMMWNLKYSGMNYQNMMSGRGGMMGNLPSQTTRPDFSSEMPVTAAQALLDAQKYLDLALPGAKAAVDADPFYGYYTIDFLRDGKTAGMLSVNGFSGQVFLHTWHGTFIEARDY